MGLRVPGADLEVVNSERERYFESVERRPSVCPADGWLARYLDYAEAQTDAPSVYHLAVGQGIVAAALGNRCWLRLYGGKVFPASWHVLLGASSYMRKSTAIRIGLNLLNAVEGEDTRTNTDTFVNPSRRGIVLPANFSKEGLEQSMQGRGDGVLPAWEFGELLAVLNKDFMGGTKEMLTRWYDGDSSARATIKDGVKKVVDPAVTIIGASTPAWLEDRVKEGDVMGGFLARFNFWPATRAESNPWKSPLENNWDRDKFNALHTSLSMMRRHRDEFQFAPQARTLFEEWLRDHENGYQASDFPAQLMGFHARIATGVLKTAMVLEAASELGSMTITAESMRSSIKIAEWLKERVAGLFTDELAFTEHAVDQRKVMGILRDAGAPVSRRDMVRKLKWPVRKVEEVLDSLVAGDRVERMSEKPTSGGLPVVAYAVSQNV